MKITVITVSFNSEATISDTLDSVALQTHPDIEHLVIDGASRDKTIEIVSGKKNHGVRLISEPDRGMYDAMNKGIAKATGDVIGFLNSDDYFADPEVLTRIARAFESSDVEASFGDLVYVKPTTERVVRHWKSRPFSKGDFAKGWCPAHPTFYARASVFHRLGGFDQSYRLGSDVELMMRFLERGNIVSCYIPFILVKMRIGGVSNKSWNNVIIQNREIYKALKNNGVKFSYFKFWAFKLIQRIRQFVLGFVRNGA